MTTTLLEATPTREVLIDARGDALRATWHPEARTVQLSLWRDGSCRATFPLSTDDAARLSMFLTASLAASASAPQPVAPPTPAWRRRLARWITGRED